MERVPGREVIDSNHPLIWYLSIPILFLSKMTSWHIVDVFRWTTIIVTIILLLWTTLLIEKSQKDSSFLNRNTFLFVACFWIFYS